MEVVMSSSTSKPLLLSAQGQQVGAQKGTANALQRYIIIHPKNMQLPYVQKSPKYHTRKLNSTQNITFANLTTNQAEQIKNLLINIPGSSIETNKERKLRDKDLEETTIEITPDEVVPTKPAPEQAG